jgi:hypothetical protein
MITSPTITTPATAGQYLAAVAQSLSACGITSRLTRPAGTPVLTAVASDSGPDSATIAIHPDPYATPGVDPQLDCTCTWKPTFDTTAQATAAAIAAVLNAVRPTVPGRSRRPPPADAARLAGFLLRYPGWSAFWDPRYGLWRAAEDDRARSCTPRPPTWTS